MAWQSSLSIVLCAVLGGCGAPRASWFPQPTARAASQAPGPLDFNWVLSGEKQVGPLQVFSDGLQTWMQWRPHQPLPAVLAMQDGGYAVVEYRRQDPYTIIEGVYPALMFRAGHHWATASRSGGAASLPGPQAGMAAAANLVQPTHALANSPQASAVYPSDGSASTNHLHPHRSSTPQPQRPSVSNAPQMQVAYGVSRTDQHLRQALNRWANLSGWRFEPEHWSVDVDIPVSAAATFSDDFIDSVQALLASTELSDRPLQPCFYTNHVLRVIPLAEACDRTVVSQESA